MRLLFSVSSALFSSSLPLFPARIAPHAPPILAARPLTAPAITPPSLAATGHLCSPSPAWLPCPPPASPLVSIGTCICARTCVLTSAAGPAASRSLVPASPSVNLLCVRRSPSPVSTSLHLRAPRSFPPSSPVPSVGWPPPLPSPSRGSSLGPAPLSPSSPLSPPPSAPPCPPFPQALHLCLSGKPPLL